MLTLALQIQDSFLQDVLQELLLQAGISLTNLKQDADGILSDHELTCQDLPSLAFLSLAKPLRLNEFLTLLHNLPHNRPLTFSHFFLDMREKTLKNLETQEEFRLTGKECHLLRYFHHRPNQNIPKEKLLQDIWDYHPETTTHTLETHIYRLRQKLEADPADPEILVNCKEGYVLKVPS